MRVLRVEARSMIETQRGILRGEALDALLAAVFLVAVLAGCIWGAVEGWLAR